MAVVIPKVVNLVAAVKVLLLFMVVVKLLPCEFFLLLYAAPKVDMTKFSKTGKVNGFDVYELELKKTGIGNIHVECKAEELYRQTALDASCRQNSTHEEKYEVRLSFD